MPKMVTAQCARCGAVFQREERKVRYAMRTAKKIYCSKECAAKQAVKEHEGNLFQKQNFPVETRIRITEKIPVFPELQPKVGAVYDALKFEKQPGSHGGYVIESGGKRINVRLDEAVEV